MSSIKGVAAERLHQIRRDKANDRDNMGLMDWIPATIPGYTRPKHLAPLVELLERAQKEPVFAVVHAPPRHGKTETICGGIARYLSKCPDRTSAYTTYGADLSLSKSRKIRDYAQMGGVILRSDSRALHEWRTREGGGLLATGVSGPLTGQGVSGLLVVDDPIKNPVEAESELYRDRVWEWFNSVAYTRLEGDCASVIVVMARWHEDDLAGRLLNDNPDKWQHIHLPAVDDNNQALWPERFSRERLHEIETQEGPYIWSSLYQGNPRRKGTNVFEAVQFFHDFPEYEDHTEAIGIDLAYSEKSRNDWSVIYKARRYGEQMLVYHMLRRQVRAPEFKKLLSIAHKASPHSPIRWYASGTEKGSADFMKEGKPAIPVTVMNATYDKFARAQPYAARWNSGLVRLPGKDSPHFAPWVNDVIKEHYSFTGVGDKHDDIVDAGAACHDSLFTSAPGYAPNEKERGKRRY